MNKKKDAKLIEPVRSMAVIMAKQQSACGVRRIAAWMLRRDIMAKRARGKSVELQGEWREFRMGRAQYVALDGSTFQTATEEGGAMASEAATPLVAIVTPVYNGARFLQETMESVQKLTYPNLVHVLNDNASTDATAEIIARYLNARVPVQVHRNEHTIPMPENWSAAVTKIPAQAKYYRLLCADDTMYPEAISKQVAVAELDDAVQLVDCLRWQDELIGGEFPKDQQVFDGREVVRGLFLKAHMGLTFSSTLLRTSLIEPGKPHYGQITKSNIDVEVNLRAALRGKVGFVYEVLADWRRHEHSFYHSNKMERIMTLEWLWLIDTFAKPAMSLAEYQEVRRQHLRFHMRTVLRRALKGELGAFAENAKNMAASNVPAGPWAYVDALADWVSLRLTGKGHLVGRARRIDRPWLAAPTPDQRAGA